MIVWDRIIGTLTRDPADGPGGSKGIRLPNVATTSLTAAATTNEGAIVYDETTSTVKFSDGTSWANVGSAAGATSLDGAYDFGGAGAGRAIDVDSGAVTMTVSNTDDNAALSLVQNDTTNNPVCLQLANTGTGADIDGDNWSVTQAGVFTGAGLASSGAVSGTTGTFSTSVLTPGIDAAAAGGFTIGGATATSVTVTPDATLSGTLDVVGTTTLATTDVVGDTTLTSAATAGNGVYIDGSTVTTGNVLRIEYDAATLNTGSPLDITEDGASVFTINEDGNTVIAGTAEGTDALTITDGDITVTDGDVTVTAGFLSVTADAAADAIDIASVATNAAIDITLPATNNVATGSIDIDGSTGSGPVIAINMSSTYTGPYLALDMTNAVGASAIDITGAGTRTVSLIEIDDTPEGANANTIDINVTPGAGTTQVIDIDVAGTDDADILCMDFAAAYTGSAVNLNMTNAVAGTAIELIGAGTRTVSLVEITDTPGGANANTIDLNVTPAVGAVAVIDIDVAGTDDCDVIDIDFAGAYTGDAINITMSNAGAAAQAIVVDGTLANSGAIVSLGTSGISTAAGSVLTATSATQPAAANVGVSARFLETGAAQATTYAVQIDSTSNEALNVSTGQSHFAEAATFLASNHEASAANYVQAGGANNAITVAANPDDTGTDIPLADGLRLVVDLGALTLQAGANTLDYIGGGAVSITMATNPAANLGTAYAANGVIELIYSAGATAWLCLSQ